MNNKPKKKRPLFAFIEKNSGPEFLQSFIYLFRNLFHRQGIIEIIEKNQKQLESVLKSFKRELTYLKEGKGEKNNKRIEEVKDAIKSFKQILAHGEKQIANPKQTIPYFKETALKS